MTLHLQTYSTCNASPLVPSSVTHKHIEKAWPSHPWTQHQSPKTFPPVSAMCNSLSLQRLVENPAMTLHPTCWRDILLCEDCVPLTQESEILGVRFGEAVARHVNTAPNSLSSDRRYKNIMCTNPQGYSHLPEGLCSAHPAESDAQLCLDSCG